jgi:hypothetical protein
LEELEGDVIAVGLLRLPHLAEAAHAAQADKLIARVQVRVDAEPLSELGDCHDE